jgi:hypothetical protein
VKKSWAEVPMPLDPEEAYEVGVTIQAQRMFAACHVGILARHAEAQMRSLLEDILRTGRARHRPDGNRDYCLDIRRPSRLNNFRLYISSDLQTVVAYETNLLERTYAQVKAGIKARKEFTSLPGSPGEGV